MNGIEQELNELHVEASIEAFRQPAAMPVIAASPGFVADMRRHFQQPEDASLDELCGCWVAATDDMRGAMIREDGKMIYPRQAPGVFVGTSRKIILAPREVAA